MIIGFTGRKYAGKDTAGAYLVRNYGFERLAFADIMKDGHAAALGYPREHEPFVKETGRLTLEYDTPDGEHYKIEMSGRESEQKFGTEMGRNTFGEDFWIEQLYDSHTWIEGQYKYAITDVRFGNEAAMIRDLGGKVVRIERPSLIKDTHVSEEQDFPVDYTIKNDGTIADLQMNLDIMVRRYGADGR